MFCRQLVRAVTPLALVAPRMQYAVARRFAATAGESGYKQEEGAAAGGAAGAAKDAAGAKPSEKVGAVDTEVHNLQAEIKTLKEELKEMKAAHLYAVADAENARRIGREDSAKAKDFAVTSFSKEMLDVADTLEKAVESIEKIDPAVTSASAPLQHTITGIKMSHNVLLKNLSRHGIEMIPAQPGDNFDPKIHDAIFTGPANDKVKTGNVLAVVKKGYMIKERVLRAAQVGVAEEAPK